jgi:hypothetical protein
LTLVQPYNISLQSFRSRVPRELRIASSWSLRSLKILCIKIWECNNSNWNDCHICWPKLGKKPRAKCCRFFLQILQNLTDHEFDGITLIDDLWFSNLLDSLEMFVKSRDESIPRVRQGIVKEILWWEFFHFKEFLILDALPKIVKFTQDYFLSELLPQLDNEKHHVTCYKQTTNFVMHMGNSICHNGPKVTHKYISRHFIQAYHPSYSPDLSLCDFWFFRLLKTQMKDCH